MTITPKEETKIYPATTRLQVNLLALHIVKEHKWSAKHQFRDFLKVSCLQQLTCRPEPVELWHSEGL